MIRCASVFLLLTLFVVGPSCGRSKGKQAAERAKPRRLIVLHTNDLHDHLGESDGSGGFARLAAAVSARREAAGDVPVLLVDAGDFSMGTLFTLLGPRAAPQLVLMGAMGYDATTIGNHDLDWGPAGLAALLDRARENGFAVPIVSSNATYDDADPGDDPLARLHDDGVIRDKVIESLPNGLRVGIFGILGPDAFDVCPDAAPLAFDRSRRRHPGGAGELPRRAGALRRRAYSLSYRRAACRGPMGFV